MTAVAHALPSLKILIPILSFGRSGGGRVLSKLASEWVASGNQVDFLVPAWAADPYFATDAGIIRSTPAGLSDERDGTETGLRNLRALRKGVGIIGDRYDVILANQSLTTWAIFLARPRTKLFYYIQAYEPEYFEVSGNRLLASIARQSYRLPFKQIVNAPIYLCYKEIAAKAWVPPGMDLKVFHPKVPRPIGNLVVLGCIGRTEPAKGTDYVIDAFARLWAADQRYRLRVAYGNLRPGWEHPGIEIIVPANDDELANYYRSLDILIAPGTVQHGAAHYPVMEAMACGTFVVTTGYIPAAEDNSWIVANRDADAICDAVRSIVSDPEAGERAKRAIDAMLDFSWPRVAQSMLEILAEDHVNAETAR